METGRKENPLILFLKKLRVKFRLLLNPSNVVVHGSCKKCGKCCRNLILVDEHRIVRTEEEFHRLKEKFPIYEIFVIKSVNSDGDLVFQCSRLSGEGTCSIYKDRPGICLYYPSKSMFRKGGKLFEGCGYYTKPAVEFNEILTGEKGKI